MQGQGPNNNDTSTTGSVEGMDVDKKIDASQRQEKDSLQSDASLTPPDVELGKPKQQQQQQQQQRQQPHQNRPTPLPPTRQNSSSSNNNFVNGFSTSKPTVINTSQQSSSSSTSSLQQQSPLSPNQIPSPALSNIRGSITSTYRGLEVNFKTVELPQDVYSIGYLAPRYSWPFWYAFLVFAIQATILWLTFLDLTKDHPKYTDQNFWNVPPEVSTEVFVAQYLALLVAVLSQDDVTTSLFFISVGVGPRYPEFQTRLQTKYPGEGSATFIRYWVTNLLRFTEGLVTILVSFVFIIQSDNVLDIFLNFAAVQFVADLDNLGFRLALEGWFGVPTQFLAKRILQEKIPIKKTKGYIDYFNQILLFLLVATLFCMNAVTVRHQKTGDYIERDACWVVNVRFGGDVYQLPPNTTLSTTTTTTTAVPDELEQLKDSARWIRNASQPPPDLHFAYFSGHYHADFEYKPGVNHKRPVYYEASRIEEVDDSDEYLQDSSLGMFYYCPKEYAWVFTIRAFIDTGAIPQVTLDRCEYGWLMRSPVTEAVVLDEAPTEGWKVWTGILSDASPLSISCLECEEDVDCGLIGGICGKKDLCECHEGMTGDFCTERYPCQNLVRFNEGVEDVVYNLDSFSYGHPVYSSFLGSFGGENLDFEHIEVLQYTGRQWMSRIVPSRVLAAPHSTGINADRHAYWSIVYFDLSQSEHYYSEPTNQYLPTGSLQWYVMDESRAEGDYGPRGREIEVEHRYSCWSLDCGASPRLCGKYGTCVTNEVLSFRNQPTTVMGGKCVCQNGYYGHFCEFKDADDEL